MFKAYEHFRYVRFCSYNRSSVILTRIFLIKLVEVICRQKQLYVFLNELQAHTPAFDFYDMSVFLRFCETLLFVWFTASSANIWYIKSFFILLALLLKSFTWW